MKNQYTILTCILSICLTMVAVQAASDSERLAEVLAAQTDEVKARYPYRHPQQTLEFFGIEPGMTLVEALPGGGWYSRIFAPYLGEQGRLVGADYALDMWPKFGFFPDEFIEAKKTWVEDWSAQANGWHPSGAAPVSAFVLGSMPEALRGSADAVLFIRALHNLNRFEHDGGYLTSALQDAFDVLRPGGTLGVVQHEAREDMPDDRATGAAGYLKKAYVIERIRQAGFELVDEATFNNDKDRPGAEDVVWRLPPGFMTSKDAPELKAKFAEIGESHRMTLKFRKSD